MSQGLLWQWMSNSVLNHEILFTPPPPATQASQTGSASPAVTGSQQGYGSRVCGCVSEQGEAEYTQLLEEVNCRFWHVILLSKSSQWLRNYVTNSNCKTLRDLSLCWPKLLFASQQEWFGSGKRRRGLEMYSGCIPEWLRTFITGFAVIRYPASCRQRCK